jgi:hypothetical protein
MPYGFTCIIKPVFGELDREPMKRTFMETHYKSFYHLPGKKLQVTEPVQSRLIKLGIHSFA